MAASGRVRTLDFADPKFVRHFAWKVWRRGIIAAFVGAVTAGIIAALSAPVYLVGLPGNRSISFFLIFGSTAFVLASAIGAVVNWVFVFRAARWAAEGRSPTDTEVRRLAGIPRVSATTVVALWACFTAPLIASFSAWTNYALPRKALEATLLIIVYSTIQSTALAFLINERTVRPILARVLPADTNDWPRTIGLTTRLLVVWFVIAGAPLLLIAFNIGRQDASQRATAGVSFVIACLLATAVGFIVFAMAGEAITAPLERMRAALKRVAEGDLQAEVSADEAGEIGLLQAGFNQMLEGLREREHMRDVFGRHVGAEVARRAMETEFGAGGDRCQATAMFVDIIASTALTQRRDPDAVVAILNRFFDAVVRVVASEGGLVNKFQGDGALCLFGTPIPCDDHALRGLRAARTLASELAPIGDIAAAIGVSSGDVVAGNVGAADRYEYTVIGDAVNEASRLTELAKLDQSRVLVSERTILAAGGEPNGWKAGDTIQLRGRSEPTVTYQLQ